MHLSHPSVTDTPCHYTAYHSHPPLSLVVTDLNDMTRHDCPYQQSNPSHSQILAAMLHPACAFTFGTQAFTEYEGARVGVTSQTWNVSNVNAVTFQDCLNMMIVDAVWMGFLAWYLAQVLPSEFGTHKPWYFVFLPSYWFECLGIKKKQEAGY